MSYQPNPNDPRFQQSGQPPAAPQGYGQYGQQQFSAYPYPPQGGYVQYPPQYGQSYGNPVPPVGPQVPLSPAPLSQSASGNPIVELQWIPPTNDAVIVDRWFKELDKEGRGIVGGLEIAMFLKRSNLPKDSLRTIWSLIDNKNLGYVKKSQFNNIIRLVSISCSPIYMGSPPSLERLQKTLYDKIALPFALLEEPAPVATAAMPAQAAPAVVPVAVLPPAASAAVAYASYNNAPPSVPSGYQYPPQSQLHPAAPAAVHDDDMEFSDFSSAGHTPAAPLSANSAGMMPRAAVSKLDEVLDEFGPMSTASPAAPEAPAPTGPQWVPPAADKELIDKWFAELDAENKGTVGGLAIAMFLKKSNLPKESLRTIWSLVDSKNAGSVNKLQFTNIIRLVSISCSPIYMGSAPSMERFEKTLNDTIRLPFALTEDAAAAESSKPSAASDAGAVYASVPMQRTPSGVTAIPVAALPAVPAPPPVREINWVPPPIDVSYLDKWFADLDQENKGTLGGLAVAMFLKRTNLPTEALRTIWSLIDNANLGYVNKVQFINMMRLAAIQCCPAYAAFPPSLERLEQTLNEFIPLPLALVHEQQPPVAYQAAPIAAVPDLNATPGAALPSPMHRDASSGSLNLIPDLSVSSDTHEIAAAAPDGPVQWVPSPLDAAYIDKWFAELDVEGKGSIGGLACAMFLKRSNLAKESLRTIWSLVDSANVGAVNKAQFANMVRLVAIQCSPIYAGVAPSLDHLRQTLQDFIPLPASLLLPADEARGPTVSAACPVPIAAADIAVLPSVDVPVSQMQVVEAGPQWVPPAADKELIDKWFAELDAENKGTVGGLAIAMFLKKSNLPKESLRTIWSLVDSKNAGSVNKLQFTNIIRLVSISCSPIYMGSAPSMERFEKTLNDEIPLPFALTDPSLSAASSAATASAFPAPTMAPVADVPMLAAASVDGGEDHGDNDDMGDFSPPVAPAGADSGSGKAGLEARPSFTLGAVAAPAPAAHRLSVFDDLVENDLKALDDDWEEFTEGAAAHSNDVGATASADDSPQGPSVPPPAVTAQLPAPEPAATASNAIDLMDLLGDDVPSEAPSLEFATNFMAPPNVVPAAKSIDLFDFDTPAVAATASIEDEDFGDFDEAPSAELSPAAGAPALDTAPSTASQQPSASDIAFEDTDFAEDDDFGDFETHSPMPSMSQLESKASLFDMETPTSNGGNSALNHSISELSLFDAPGDQVDDFMQDAFAGGLSSKPSTQEVDLLDFLSEPAPAPAPFPVPKPAHAGHHVAPFAAFEDPFGAPVAASTGGSFGTASSGSLQNDDFFGAPVAAPAAAAAPSAVPRDTAELLKRKHLKSKVLDALTATLMKKCLYEHAYNCNEQAKIARNIEDLTAQKTQAVEDDDLETAMILKKDIALQQLKMCGVDQEALWEEEAQSGRSGESLQETADLLCAVDEVMGAKYKRAFLTALPPTTAPLDTQLKFYVTAKRYARMILAICSTHTMYPKQWLQVLQVAVAKVKEGNEIVARFKRLSEADRNALISHLKMSEYALGLVAMSEIGMWVSASCTEAMVHEKIAGEVYSVCQDLLAEVDQLWGMGSRFKTMDMETPTLEAARLAESKNVQYCNFTLRPLSYEVCKRDGDKMKLDRVKLYDSPVLIENSHFMEPVIKLWLHDVAKDLPQCAAAVF